MKKILSALLVAGWVLFLSSCGPINPPDGTILVKNPPDSASVPDSSSVSPSEEYTTESSSPDTPMPDTTIADVAPGTTTVDVAPGTTTAPVTSSPLVTTTLPDTTEPPATSLPNDTTAPETTTAATTYIPEVPDTDYTYRY
ncbi:MAG: hypothetical protein GX057_07905 [Clostridiales bacterium]|nr:hypothetical protein [Clostridiales bacterium]